MSGSGTHKDLRDSKNREEVECLYKTQGLITGWQCMSMEGYVEGEQSRMTARFPA